MKSEKPKNKSGIFHFKQFSVIQNRCAMKVGTDGVLLGAWANVNGSTTALDIGTGTGVIAMMLAQRNRELVVHAVDIDPESCLQASENMNNSLFSARLTVFHASIQEHALTSGFKYDLIVSNPPFFSASMLSATEPQQHARHTTKLSHEDLLTAVQHLLKPDGRFCLILPIVEGKKITNTAERFGLYCSACTEVSSKYGKPPERLLLQFEFKENSDLQTETITILAGEGRHNYTEKYTELLRDFYTIL